MSIPADAIVQVNPSLLVPGGADLELNGVFVVDDNRIPPGVVLPFSNPSDVKSYLSSHPSAGELAGVYFRGYKNSSIKPRVLYMARWVADDSAPYIVGSKLGATLAELKAIVAGTLTLSMAGESRTLTDLDFSAATSLSEVGVILEAAMVAAASASAVWLSSTCLYDSSNQAFLIGSTTKGVAEISPPTGTVAVALNLSSGTAFVGAVAQTPDQVMDAITRVTTNWVTFLAARKYVTPTPDEQIGFSQWSNSKGVRHLYVANSNDVNLLIPGNTTNIGYQLQQLNLSAVAAEYGGLNYAAFLMGVAASIDYNRPGGAITTAFKSQDGIAYNVTDETTAVQLETYGFNYYGHWATANDQFRFHYPGQMFGDYQWIDTYLNAIWLNNALQVALLSGLTSFGRSPYNRAGYTFVRAWMQDPVQRALSAGVIDTDIVLSESQKADINQQAGMDITGQLLTSGYFIQIIDPGPIARKNRQSPIINFWYTYGGAIQKLVVASKAVV